MWEIKYTKEVRNYLYDSYPYTAEVWQAAKALRAMDRALPMEEHVEIEPGVYLWRVAGHFVIYRKIESEQIVRILVMKPGARQ